MFLASVRSRLLSLVAALACALCGSLSPQMVFAQTAVADPAVPVTIAITPDGQQFFAVNQDRSLFGYATSQTSLYSLLCPGPAGLTGAPAAGLPIAFDSGSRFLFETGLAATGTNAIVGAGASFSGTTCNNTPALPFYGTSVLLSANDRRNKRAYVVSSAGPGTPDVITSIGTNGAGDYYQANSLTKRGQTSLDSGGTYSAIAPDTDGTVGYVAITQVRTGTSPGALWIYDPTFNRTVKILGPGGVALPAVNAFILHNAMSVGGGLLVLTNQDLLTASNLGAPPTVTTPFTLIDMGQLGALLQAHPTDSTVTLPSVTTISSNLSYYAIFGSAFNSVDNKMYLLIGTGTSVTNPIRQVIRYDPFHPLAPGEAPVADLSSVPLYPGALPQIALNSAAGTLQILTTGPNAVYTVDFTGTGDTAKTIPGSFFGDSGFQPTFVATNPLLGETYIASGSGKVDIVTLPGTRKVRGTINLNGPLSPPTAGTSTQVQIESLFPLSDSALASTPITITATAASTGSSFTFATQMTALTLPPTRYITGTFPSNDIYTLVASFPGDATYGPVSSLPAVVAVGTPLYPTTISVAATASTATAGTATVTLLGSTYTPTGTIVIQDPVATRTLATYTVVLGQFSNPISIPFTIPAGTTSVTATYSGDSINGLSHSAVANIVSTAPKSNTHLTVNAPSTATPNVPFTTTVFMSSDNNMQPTGQVILNATPTGSTASQVGTATTSQAFNGGAPISVTLPAGTYTLQAAYAGDANFASSGSNSVNVTVAASGPAAASLNPTSLSFTAVTGTTSGYQNVTLSNTGGAALTLSSITITGSGFAQVNGCPTSLASGANCIIRITYSPTSGAGSTGTLSVADNATGSPQTVALTGTVTPGAASVSPSSVSFIDQTVGTGSFLRPQVTLINAGTAPYTITSITLSNTTDFEMTRNQCGSQGSLPPGTNCTVSLEFHPTTVGAKTATLLFNTSNSTVPQTVTLTGKGLSGNPASPPNCVDADGDGLCDDWETNGVWVRTSSTTEKFVDLPSMGADPRHKDIFVQADFMETAYVPTGDHSHQMTANAAIQELLSFDQAPVMNPDLTTGIHLHVDCGPTCIMILKDRKTWGALSQSVGMIEQPLLDTIHTGTGQTFDWTKYDQASSVFLASGRSLIFHHAIMAHMQNAGNSSSGLSRNGTNFNLGASDLIVSFGGWASVVGTDSEQAGTLMHELGHNLGLHHGGDLDDNYKPNYLSVMNYYFQTGGVIFDNGKGTGNGFFDYSRFLLPALDETKLDEVNGLNASATSFTGAKNLSISKYGTMRYCNNENPLKVAAHVVNYVDGNVNWNCNQLKKTVGSTITLTPYIDPGPVNQDINADGVLDLVYNGTLYALTSFNDWPALVYTGGSVAGNGLGQAPPAITQTNEITQEQDSLIPKPYMVAIQTMGRVRSAPKSTITLNVVIANTGTTDDTYKLSASTVGGWVINASLPASVAVPAKGSATVSVTYTVPANANDGDKDVLLITAQSQNNDFISDTKEVGIYATATPFPDSLSRAQIVFGSQPLGSTSAAQSVTILNTGSTNLSFGPITTTAEFSETDTCSPSLAIGASCVVSVTFTPGAAGQRSGTLTINDGTGTAKTLPLTGNAVPAAMPTPAVTLTTNTSTTSTGQTVTFNVNVSGGTTAVPAGTVTIANGTTQIGQVTLDASGNGTFTSATLTAGTYVLIATYSGDATFRSTSSPATALTVVLATRTTIALTTSAASVTTGSPVTFTATIGGGSGTSQPGGSVTFLDGTTVLGAGVLNAAGVATYTTSSLGLGVHNITASYAGDNVFGASVSTIVAETISAAPAATTTALTSSVTSATVGTAVVFTATVAATTGTPGGSVTFVEGSATLGTGTLNAGGVAQFTTNALTVGTHSIVAQYAGSASFAASASAARQVTVTGLPTYSVAVTPTSLTVKTGSAATAAIAVTPVNGYAGTVTFGCSGLPSNATCAFAPQSLVFTAASASAQTVTLTFDTRLHAALVVPFFGPVKAGVSVTALALMLWLPASLLGVFGRRSRKHKLPVLLGCVLALFALASVTGCGSNGSFSATTPGTYNVTVSLTDGSNAQTVPYTVVVTQ